MKKIAIVFAAAMAAFFFASCNKEEVPVTEVVPEEVQPAKPTIIFDIIVEDFDPETRAAKTNWVKGDKINFWFDGNRGRTPDLVLTRDENQWVPGELREGLELKSKGNLVAVYESQNDLAQYQGTESDATFACKRIGTINETPVLSPSSMVVGCRDITYYYSNSTLTVRIVKNNWYFYCATQFTISGIPDGEYALHIDGVDASLAPMSSFQVGGGEISVTKQSPAYVSVVGKDEEAVVYYWTFERWDEKTVTFTLVPKVDGAFSLVRKYVYSPKLPFMLAGSYKAFNIPFQKFNRDYHEYVNDHEYVDLGLPSGRKWATHNVGASQPEEYGDYYAWGEDITYYYYTTSGDLVWRNDWPNGYEEDTYEANVGEIFDTATLVFGEPWRTPTKADWEELMNTQNCTWEWKTINNVHGFAVTSKVNDRGIFLPVGGYYSYKTLDGVGTIGSYWSSTKVEQSTTRAWSVDMFSFGPELINAGRYLGQSVRPVTD